MDGKPWIDPTPKRNHIFESQITGKQEIHKLVIKLTPPTTTTTLTVLGPDGFAAGKNKEGRRRRESCKGRKVMEVVVSFRAEVNLLQNGIRCRTSEQIHLSAPPPVAAITSDGAHGRHWSYPSSPT